MKFKKLKLYTNKLESELNFYSKTLGFKVLEQNTNYFSIKVGWSELSFEKTEREYKYHYCFLIPSNKLNEALEWMEKRTEIINIGNGRKTQNFDSWNADSFYFYDASGNIAEFIVRYDLNNDDSDEFDISKVLGVNEMGMPTANVKKTNDQLKTELQTEYWKGDINRFGTNGSQEGIFLLPNYNLKDIWFPTSIKIKPEPFEAVIENKEIEYHIEYRNEKIKTTVNNS
ncbi:VOC family protein [Tenacibaculum sp. M341]|uniref:VOC family protein n=1 Tax=Tenacibaculum sp. M341 TaxID=2530339 RepID=UPI001048C1EA|nr:VOC family protein [Tenacibaculum sp. M341]TCI93731.1 glyoxalase [Tenacibaculum sp. M341]